MQIAKRTAAGELQGMRDGRMDLRDVVALDQGEIVDLHPTNGRQGAVDVARFRNQIFGAA
jgi:hypothetical protein